ncbi:MAG TPA: SMP-30/gluconolactonase/LRE family protein [Gemmataceae bacterium]|jgi:hypothetical protein|nr:SMP-30/gluconolactonase/LRE family protein [Gemmataceae bacterium]
MKRFWPLLIVLVLSPIRLAAQDIPLSQILVAKEGWHEVARGLPHVTSLEAEADGGIRIQHDGQVSRLGPDGKIAKLPEKTTTSLTTRAGSRFEIDAAKKRVVANTASKRQELHLDGLANPLSLTLWPDEGHLVIGESHGAWLWAVRIETDGSLGPGDRYYSLRTETDTPMRVTAMTMDAAGLLYACTPIGIQAFDPTGRLCGVFTGPAKEMMTAITLGGPQGDTLFVASGEALYARKIRGKAPYTLNKK